MSSPEILFCKLAETQYNSTQALISNLLGLTPALLRLLKTNIKFYEKFVLDVCDANLLALENKLLSMSSFASIEDNARFKNAKLQFCRTAYACEAVRALLFPADGNDPVFVSSIPLSVRNTLRYGNPSATYALLEKYVCKLSLRAILDGFRAQLIQELRDLLALLEAKLGYNKIDEMIQRYFTALANTGILAYLDILDRFAQCAFETCNFAATALNFREDVADKTQMTSLNGQGWAFATNSYIDSVYAKEAQLRVRMNLFKAKLNLFDSNNVSGSNVKKTDVTKG